MNIRSEQPADHDAVRLINTAAFESPAEANLVDALRSNASPLISLVAESDQAEIVGHILFSPATLAEHPDDLIMGLAPMAVTPARQRQGIGSALVREGLEQCSQLGALAVVVLGHPAYYPRFGFAPASRLNIDSDYDVPDDVFLAMELQPGAMSGKAGRIEYHEAFRDL